MTSRRDDAPDLSPAGAFDKLLIVLAVLGAAVAMLAAVVAFRGEPAAAQEGVEDETQTVHFALSEFAIEGETDIAAGPTVFDVTNCA